MTDNNLTPPEPPADPTIVQQPEFKQGRRGETDKGVPLVAYIAMVSPTLAHDDPRQQEFVTDLQEITKSVAPGLSEHRASLDPKPPGSFDARYFLDFDDDDDPYDDGEDYDAYGDDQEDWEGLP
jgi:hypothetical protein